MKKTNLLNRIFIDTLSHDGRGIAKIDGKTTFVKDAIPGDVVTIRLTQQSSNYDEAQLVEIEEPSADRIEPLCEYYSQCGGCQLQHQSISAQRHWKNYNFITRLTQAVNSKHAKIEPMICGTDQGYRRRARFGLSISKQDKQARFGFRQKNSNELVDIEHCPVLTPALNQAVSENRKELLELASRAEREFTFIEADNGVFITQNQDNAEHSDLNLEPYYQLNELTLNFPADGFIQVNAELNKQMVNQAMEWLELEAKHKVLDLFCGVGNFTLPMAQIVKHVTGIEGLQPLVETAQQNAVSNQQNNTDFFKANLFEDCTKSNWFRKQKYHRVLLDPGRQGAFEISKTIHLLKPEIIVYVSCNAATLIRDIKEMEKQGYLLHKACLIDMFPHTTHTEVMVQLKKTKQPKKRDNKTFRF